MLYRRFLSLKFNATIMQLPLLLLMLLSLTNGEISNKNWKPMLKNKFSEIKHKDMLI